VQDGNLAAPEKRRGGRPSKADAERLAEHILDVATGLFLTEGYGATSIEAVAQQARIAKRTFYARFGDKAGLFAAVVHRIVERLRPSADVRPYEGASCEEILRRLARLILHAALTPEALALNRLLLAESSRFPELAAVVAREAAGAEAVRRIGDLLEGGRHAGRLRFARPQFAAEHLLQMIVGQPQRRALGLGTPMSEAELDAWADDTVTLFLYGCRGREEPTA
jgi:TetR/AcrR family transcriptional regulator, mexJK operon transcriptional repressor